MRDKMNNHFELQMLGSFEISYEGDKLVLGRNSTAKFLQLLQLVWLYGDKGVTREQLMKSLYERESLSNSNNSLNNLIYQLRKQMTRAGLPDYEYISRKEGRYFSDAELDIQVDALQFEQLIGKAEQEPAAQKKYEYYSQAFELYKGELLPSISTELWVTEESLRYKEDFRRCVLWVGEYYKRQKEYNAMCRVYQRAADIYPFDDWQVYVIDGLLCKGEHREAYQLYDKTAKLYSEEMGLPPSDMMMECYHRMSEKITGCPGDITEIKAGITEIDRKLAKGGAFYCSYPSFVDVYHLLSSDMERSGRSIFLMICTLVDYEGKMIQNQDKLKTRSQVLKEAIMVTLRRGDAFTRYSSSQYLVLLVGTKQEDCEIIYRRIVNKFKEMAGSRAELSYNVVSLAELAAP